MVRIEPSPFELTALAFAHFHGLQDPDEALGCFLQFDTGTLKQVDERSGRAVQNRHFLGGDVHHQVVDTESGAGTHQVLDGVHLGPAIGDGRGQPCVRHRLGRDRNIHRLGQIDAPKDDTGIGHGRTQRQLNALTTVQPDADSLGQGFEGSLRDHGPNFRFLPVFLLARGPKTSGHGLSRPACAGRRGSRNRPCHPKTGRRPWLLPRCGRGCARRWARPCPGSRKRPGWCEHH